MNYGAEYGVTFESERGKGTTVRITIPEKAKGMGKSMYRLVVIDDEYNRSGRYQGDDRQKKNWSMKWWDALMMESMGWK